LHVCTTSSPGPTKNQLLSWSAKEDARGRRTGTAPLRHRGNSLSCGGGGQHRWRWTGTWPQGLLLVEPPPRVAGHTCDRDEAAMETKKAEDGEGDRRRKAGRSIYQKCSDANDMMINKHQSPMKGRGQVCSNEEQFAFPLLICNQILYHVFLRQP
jgi:hypothetical protein